MVYYSQNITMTLFTVLLFCACCYFVVYTCGESNGHVTDDVT